MNKYIRFLKKTMIQSHEKTSMFNIKWQRGQALIETILAMSAFVLLCVWALPLLNQTLEIRAQTQEKAQLILQQAPWRGELSLKALDFEMLEMNYAYPNVEAPDLKLAAREEKEIYSILKPVWSLLGAHSGLDLATNNLYELVIQAPEQDEIWFKFVRLADDWSPRKVEHLASRPRALTSSQFLMSHFGEGFQRVVSVLPWGRELHPRQLQFGYIDPDVIPESRLCKKRSCS